MTDDEKKRLSHDADGLLSYEYLANHIVDCPTDDIDAVIDNMISVDLTGQYLASAARYLHAIDPATFKPQIDRLVAATIDKDREHRFLGDILNSIYGPDSTEHAAELSATDNNFRRIYKRLYPNPDSL